MIVVFYSLHRIELFGLSYFLWKLPFYSTMPDWRYPLSTSLVAKQSKIYALHIHQPRLCTRKIVYPPSHGLVVASSFPVHCSVHGLKPHVRSSLPGNSQSVQVISSVPVGHIPMFATLLIPGFTCWAQDISWSFCQDIPSFRNAFPRNYYFHTTPSTLLWSPSPQLSTPVSHNARLGRIRCSRKSLGSSGKIGHRERNISSFQEFVKSAITQGQGYARLCSANVLVNTSSRFIMRDRDRIASLEHFTMCLYRKNRRTPMCQSCSSFRQRSPRIGLSLALAVYRSIVGFKPRRGL